MAAGIELSGTGMTTSASVGASRASSTPSCWRTWCTLRPCHTESGREKYTNSNEQRAALALRREHLDPFDLGAAQRDHLAGLHLVDVDAAEGGERARLAGHRVAAVGESPDRQRSETPRVAHGDHLVGGEDDQGERALPRRQRAFDAVLPGLAAGGGEHQRQHLGVARRGEPEARGSSSSSRSAAAFTRLPLWARASGPCIVSMRNGWMLRSAFDPVVE